MQVPRPTPDLWNQNPHFNKMSCQRGDNMDGLGVWKQSLQTEMAVGQLAGGNGTGGVPAGLWSSGAGGRVMSLRGARPALACRASGPPAHPRHLASKPRRAWPRHLGPWSTHSPSHLVSPV